MPAVQDSINAIRVAAEAADRIKATDIVAFDVADLLGITDIMMIAGASNERQVLAVAEEIEKDLFLKCDGRQPRSREGLTEGQWILLDYGDFVIHVMHDEAREFYGLERLWKDCESSIFSSSILKAWRHDGSACSFHIFGSARTYVV